MMVEEEYFKFSHFHKLSDSGFVLHHIDGGLFQLSPDDRFVGKLNVVYRYFVYTINVLFL